MDGEILKIKVFQEVMTPNGPGLAIGKIVDRDETILGNIRILVSHDPKKVKLPPEILVTGRGGPSIFWAYDLDQLEMIA